ncbi:hypothetical protein [Streptomyces sp. NBC_00887]|uniref:hypothetical protein n=1 Tax=Streptomyces sp. NBC_00887 TaxID=2975859 RepID=UPI00386C4B5E|nr:hypothetical protein OG844_46290 [Streptomyces sp. NBC_00887]
MAMSQDFAAISAGTFVAILLVGAIELANTFGLRAALEEKTSLMFASEVKESALAIRTGTELPEEKRLAIDEALATAAQLTKQAQALLTYAVTSWLGIYVFCGTSLVAVLVWSAQKDGKPDHALAIWSILIITLSLILILVAFSARLFLSRKITIEEQRRKAAQELGIPVGEVSALVARWRRHHGFDS